MVHAMNVDPVAARRMAMEYAKAWSSGSPKAVASFYAADGQITINRGDTLKGYAAIEAMAAGFYEAFPDLVVLCDDFRSSSAHAIFVWTLEGHHSATKNLVRIGGWEEWELTPECKIETSSGWFSVEEYEAQIEGRPRPAAVGI